MSIYEDEMFRYITKAENFETAFEISELFPQVKRKVIEQFWKQVNGRLLELIKGTDWEVSLDDVFSTWSSLNLTRGQWKGGFQVRFEKLHENTYYGLRLNVDDKSLDVKKIHEHAKTIQSLQDIQSNNLYWLGMKSIGENFNSMMTMRKILPDTSKDFADELAKLLFDLAEELKQEVDIMNEMRR